MKSTTCSSPSNPLSYAALAEEIEDMAIDQLLELNRLICRHIDQLQDQESLQALSRLDVTARNSARIEPR